MAKSVQATMDELSKKLKTDVALRRAFYRDPFRLAADFGVPWKYLEGAERIYYESRIEGQDHLARGLSKHDVPLKTALTNRKGLKAGGQRRITTKAHKVLGVTSYFKISLNARTCEDVQNGLLGVDGVSALIAGAGLITGPLALVIGGVITLEAAAIGLANRGKGVHYFVTPVQLLLPESLVGSMVPLPN